MLDVVQAFFDKEYISSHPEDTEKITQLKDLMQEQVNTLSVQFNKIDFGWVLLIFRLINSLHK